MQLAELPPVDPEPRAILVDRVLPASATVAEAARGMVEPVWNGALVPRAAEVRAIDDGVEIVLETRAAPRVRKRLRFLADGRVSVDYHWSAAEFPGDALFAPELSLAGGLVPDCGAAEVWEFAITTVAKSERGFDETRQGTSFTPRWPVAAEAAHIELA